MWPRRYTFALILRLLCSLPVQLAYGGLLPSSKEYQCFPESSGWPCQSWPLATSLLSAWSSGLEAALTLVPADSCVRWPHLNFWRPLLWLLCFPPLCPICLLTSKVQAQLPTALHCRTPHAYCPWVCGRVSRVLGSWILQHLQHCNHSNSVCDIITFHLLTYCGICFSCHPYPISLSHSICAQDDRLYNQCIMQVGLDDGLSFLMSLLHYTDIFVYRCTSILVVIQHHQLQALAWSSEPRIKLLQHGVQGHMHKCAHCSTH